MDPGFTMYSFTDLSPYHLPDELILGNLRNISEFTQLDTLGHGSSSSVYRAIDKRDKKEVAIKHLRYKGTVSVLTREIFREITILKSLDHNNIIKLHEVVNGQSINNLCLVLEYCPNSLDKYIDCYSGDIPHSHVKCVIKQMLQGLNHMHKSFIMHRDLKTPNLMISPDGILKIIDFGLSRRFSLQDKPSSPDICTRWYQSPEVLLGAPTYGPEVDMWSAACIMSELFKKKPILPGNSDIQQINMIVDLIGAPDAKDWPGVRNCKVLDSIKLRPQPFNRVSERFHELGGTEAVQILENLFVYNPSKRMTAEECLQHDWFDMAPMPSERIEVPKRLMNHNMLTY